VNLLVWIENSSLAEYIRVSAYGYPAMITLHSLGLAIMVGLSVVLGLRELGYFSAIPYSSLGKLLRVAWIGFIVNTISGSCLFAAQATTYVTDTQFILKMTFVVIGAVFVALLQGVVNANVAAGITRAAQSPPIAKFYAVAEIVAWVGATITGRLIAYL
jgi:hypothetical protein